MQSYWEVKKEKIAELPGVLLVLSFYLASISFINALILHDTVGNPDRACALTSAPSGALILLCVDEGGSR